MAMNLVVAPGPGRVGDARSEPAVDPVFWLATVGAVLLWFGIDGPVTAAVLTISLVLLPGSLVVGLVRPRDGLEQVVTVVAVSVVTWMLIAHVLLSFRWWNPEVVAAAGLGTFAVLRLIQRRGRMDPEGTFGTWRPGAFDAGRLPARQVVVGVVALGLWWWSTAGLDLSDVGLLGLAAELPPMWFAGFAIAVVGAAWAATAPRIDAVRLVVGIVPLLVIIYGTTAVATGTIRYPWAYKHVGVVRLFDETGRLHPDVDIYNNFSGFFGIAALVRGATGVDPTAYAAWAQLVGEGLAVLAVGYLVHRATESVRVASLAVVVYVLTNWVGQNYFAAQTLATFLALVTLGMIWSWFRVPRGGDPRAASDDRTHAVRRIVVGLVFLGLLMVHPLTPIVVVGAVIVGVASGSVRDRWLLGALIAVGIFWFTRTFTYFAAQDFDLGFGGSPADNGAGNVDDTNAPADSLLIGRVTQYFSLAVWLLAAIGGVLASWARRRIGVLVVLAMIPFGILLVQSYGGEAIYRVYLYSLPLMAALIAWGVVSTTPVVRRARLSRPTVLASLLCLGLAAGFVVVHYGREAVNTVDRSEIAMDRYIDGEIEAPAILAQFAGGYPAQSTARYPEFQVTDTYTPHIVEMVGSSTVVPPPSALFDVADDLVELTPGTPYVVVSPGMIDDLAVTGGFPVDTTEEAARFLLSNPRFELTHRIDDTYLIEVAR